MKPLARGGQSLIGFTQIHLNPSQPRIGAGQSRIGKGGFAIEVESLVIQIFPFAEPGITHLELGIVGDSSGGLLQNLPGLVLPTPSQVNSGQSKVSLSQLGAEFDGPVVGLECLLDPVGFFQQAAPAGVEAGFLRKALQSGTDFLQPPGKLSLRLADPDQFGQNGRPGRVGVHGPPKGLLALLPLLEVEVEVSDVGEDRGVARQQRGQGGHQLQGGSQLALSAVDPRGKPQGGRMKGVEVQGFLERSLELFTVFVSRGLTGIVQSLQQAGEVLRQDRRAVQRLGQRREFRHELPVHPVHQSGAVLKDSLGQSNLRHGNLATGGRLQGPGQLAHASYDGTAGGPGDRGPDPVARFLRGRAVLRVSGGRRRVGSRIAGNLPIDQANLLPAESVGQVGGTVGFQLQVGDLRLRRDQYQGFPGDRGRRQMLPHLLVDSCRPVVLLVRRLCLACARPAGSQPGKVVREGRGRGLPGTEPAVGDHVKSKSPQSVLQHRQLVRPKLDLLPSPLGVASGQQQHGDPPGKLQGHSRHRLGPGKRLKLVAVLVRGQHLR